LNKIDNAQMQDFQFVSFFLGHDAGDRARRLLADCELLDVALSSRANRHAWSGDVHFGVSLRLPVEDKRLKALLERLRAAGEEPFTRLDREHSPEELDSADWLILRVATAGLYGGVDYGQSYRFENACGTCGAGAELVPPLVAELGKMGKKDIDHLVYEGHFIVTKRIAAALGRAGLTGIEPTPVQTQRRPPSAHHVWLRITSEFPRLHESTTGYETEAPCTVCGRGGHYGSAKEPEAPRYNPVPADTPDFNRTWEYFGDWRQVRSEMHLRPVGGSQGVVVSQRARRVLQDLRVRRLVWIPMSPA
jgi:hypothetical protein